MRTIKQIIEDIEKLTESAQVDSKSHSRHNKLQVLLQELSETLKEISNGKS